MKSREIDSLLMKIADGDIEALECLYKGMKKPVYFYALRLSGNSEMAEDAVQDTFISIMRNSGSYTSTGSGAAWIFRIAKHRVLDYQKKKKLLPQPEEELPDPSCQIDRLLSDHAFFDMLAPLTQKERDIVILRILVGLSLTDAALELGLPKGSVFWSYHNAMKKLKKSMKGETADVR
jgi:RNA polymerase sigma-70 factor (ECF subfamily)